jgi:hypothetical protein
MRDLRRQNRSEEASTEDAVLSRNVMKFTEENNNLEVSSNSDDLVLAMQAKMKALEDENSRLKDTAKILTKNEEKLLSAIKSERINQDKEKPIISRSMLIKKYAMGNKYLDSSITGLESKGYIERKPVNYSAKIKTNSWMLLK